MRRLKIISDGTPEGTRLVDSVTSEDLKLPIKSIVWRFDVESFPTAEVTLLCPLATLVADTVIGGPDGPVENKGGSDR